MNEKRSKIDEILDKLIPLLYQIPKGKVTTYAILARIIGTSPRVVGKALGKNRSSAPCHRVVKSNGEIGGFRNSHSREIVKEKIRLLKNEGIKIKHDKIVNLKEYLYNFRLE